MAIKWLDLCVLAPTHKSLGFPWLLFVVFSAFLAGSITKVKAGTVTFSDRAGNYFNFKNISEYGPNIPPSILDLPTLISNAPYDSITFQPTAFVAVESNLGTRESSTLGSNLQFTLASRSLSLALRILKLLWRGHLPGSTCLWLGLWWKLLRCSRFN